LKLNVILKIKCNRTIDVLLTILKREEKKKKKKEKEICSS
jgi:hypothetical protein